MPSDPDLLLRDLVARLATGPGTLDPTVRQNAVSLGPLPEALAPFAAKLVAGGDVTGDDVAVLRSAGLSQRQVIELTVCLAMGIAQARMKAGLVALEETVAW